MLTQTFDFNNVLVNDNNIKCKSKWTKNNKCYQSIVHS